jgi:asparagine synthase (glutamine-hydrolysing)
MCGIAGSINFPLEVKRVQNQLKHRGPDEQTYWSGEGVQLLHTRLAIQELSEAGRQPMQQDEFIIVFNGEIYNHYELRKKYNLTCFSHSDTETLLHLFRKLGIQMLHELDGMFAFALYDTRQNLLWLVRDRAGEKPLYYYRENERLLFASELPVIREAVNPSIQDQRISNFLTVGYLLPDETPYDKVHELPGGHYLKWNVGNATGSIHAWWNVLDQYSKQQNGSEEDYLARLDDMLMQSVRRRITSSDLEVGTFLSGGIDSGLVTAMASKLSSSLKTFTVSFEGLYDEAPLAHHVATHLGTQHYPLSVSLDDLEKDLEKIFVNYGEPIMDDSIIPSYYVAREAKKHLTVILNGDAGDELFGGYRRYVPFRYGDFFKGWWKSLFRPAKAILPLPTDKMGNYNFLYRLISLAASKSDHVYFTATNDLLQDYVRNFSIQPDLNRYGLTLKEITKQNLSPLQQIMAADFKLLLSTTLLVKMDIATMAHSLEGRSPFLSNDLLDWAPGLPDQVKIKGTTTKYLLRKLASQYLPEDIIHQPKRGFEVPLKDWVDSRLKSIIFDYLSPNQAYVKKVMKASFIDDLLEKKVSMPAEQRAKVLFALLSVECWRRQVNS